MPPSATIFGLPAILLLLTAPAWLPHDRAHNLAQAQAISIRPGDFDRLIMPCYLGGNGGGYAISQSNGPSSFVSTGNNGPGMSYGSLAPLSGGTPASIASQSPYYGGGGSGGQFGRQSTMPGNGGGGPDRGAAGPSQYNQPPAYFAASESNGGRLNGNGQQSLSPPNPFAGGQARDSLTSNLGQSVPRANTIDNFIALVNKIEVANPRLANNPDQLIRSLLSRFRLDNYYYDVRSRTPISEQDRRYTDIQPVLLNQAPGGQMPMQQSYGIGSSPAMDMFPEQLLDHDEKCSMYFMLSHFVDKSTPAGNYQYSLGQLPVNQLAGPLNGQRPPSLQAAGSGYPAQSANSAYTGGASGSRYPGPAPSFGSPATSNMNAFGTGIQNTSPEALGARSPYGVNTPMNSGPGSNQQLNSQLANSNLRNPNAQYPAIPARPPYVDARANQQQQQNQFGRNDDRIAVEYGVVTLPNQDNAALVLNRVLLGLLAATTPPQSIRQLASLIYPTQSLTSTPKLDEEIDPLFAVTLADLWAISAIPKAGKPFDVRLLGVNGHWNDTMCPTTFTLDRSSSIKFTTAELLGGLDGFNLGMFRRRLISMRRNIRLSEMLRIYYSKTGFRPQFAEVGVCQRGITLNGQLDDLHRQAENYLRLYQLSLPTSDNEIATLIGRLDAFREVARMAANTYAPQDLCLESQSELYPMNSQDSCEISRADVVSVLDTSPQANQAFMRLLSLKLAQKLGLSRDTNSFSILTNQQDTMGYAGAYSFNAIVRNSTNLGEIGCALVHDTSSTYQGGQISDPTRLMEMFERALVNLDSEYLTRQMVSGGFGGSSSSSSSSSLDPYNGRGSSYVSSWFNGGSDQGNYGLAHSGGPRNTGGSKVVIWFNYGPQLKPSQAANGPTNWYPGQSSSSSWADQNEYKFFEAKKYLRENFRGASILAVSPNRDGVKAFVFDEERDIFTDIPSGNTGLDSLASAEYYPSSASSGSAIQESMAALMGPSEQLANKLLQRMCTIPALFQYPMCFRTPSNNVMSVGYISPGRKQYWMMSPKTFFASRAIRLVFRVEGGRLKVCFGRKPNPDETSLRNQQQNQQYQPSSPSITFQQQQQMNGGSSSPNGQASSLVTTQAPVATSSDYYTGMDYGVCKDVSPGQEIDFLISDPCYKKSISECEPFYIVIRETSQPGEGDPNYMCRDDGCKRFDQAKFVLTHTGVSCSSALKGVQANWFLIMISLLAASLFSLTSENNKNYNNVHKKQRTIRIEFDDQSYIIKKYTKSTREIGRGIAKSLYSCLALVLFASYVTIIQQVEAQQQAGVYDFGQNRYGEKRGNFTPSEVLAIILIVMLNVAGLALAIGLCFYVTKRARRGHLPVAQDGY